MPDGPEIQHAGLGWSDSDLVGSITQRFERIVRQYPHRCAITAHGQRLTYDELNRSANRLAHYIVATQGASNDPVAILMNQGPPMIAAILAVLKAGKIYVPLDPAASIERIQSILSDCRPNCILTDDATRAHAATAAQVIDVDALDGDACMGNLCLELKPDTLASIIYTSGSTDTPKGVVEDHKYILRIIRAYSRDVCISPKDKLILLFSLSANGSHGNLFGALLNGATIHCVDARNGELAWLGESLREEKITIYYSSATVFRQFAETLQDGETFPDVRIVQLSAEPILPKDFELAKRHFSPDCVFINRFGATETGPFLQYRLPLAKPLMESALPLGFPIDGTEAYLVDDEGKKIGSDATGQLVVQSRYLSRGYWNKPELTATKFFAGPADSDESLYLTGDLGRMTADGCFFLVGRKDFEVKIRGYRVNTNDVETTILIHPDIKDAAVLSQPGREGEMRLVAYYVAAKDTMPGEAQLRGHLRKHLPEYMIPSAFIQLAVFPLTASGKVDRRALPSLPRVERPPEESSFCGPRTVVEEALAKIWIQILEKKRVGINDSFLEIGGDSINALQIIGRVRALFGVDMSMQLFMDTDAGTVATMAEWIERAIQDACPTDPRHI
jgi:amino acid adenylation domain-containing protein